LVRQLPRSDAVPDRVRRRTFGRHERATGRSPFYFRLAAGSWTGTCGEVLITLVLPSE